MCGFKAQLVEHRTGIAEIDFFRLPVSFKLEHLNKGRSGFFSMRTLCTTRRHSGNLILVICIALGAKT